MTSQKLYTEGTIPAWNIPSIQKKIDKLNKRAKKIGQIGFTLVEGQRTIKTIPRNNSIDHLATETVDVEVVNVSILGASPKIEGFDVVAIIEHDLSGLGISPIVHRMEDIDVSPYLNVGNCDHCGHKRKRGKTIIVQNKETGELRQIGRTCIRDYFGYEDAEQIIRLFESLYKTFGGFNGDEEEYYTLPSRLSPLDYVVFETHQFLLACAQSTINEGFQPSENGIGHTYKGEIVTKPATKVDAEFLYSSNNFSLEAQGLVEGCYKLIEEWKNDPRLQDNDYKYNLVQILSNDHVKLRHTGFVASLPNAVLREQSRKREQEYNKVVSTHFGSVGEKFKGIVAKLTRINEFQGYYGNGQVLTFKDSQGHTFTWFTSSYPEVEEGFNYILSGTVKDHKEYKSTKQTVVKNVKVKQG